MSNLIWKKSDHKPEPDRTILVKIAQKVFCITTTEKMEILPNFEKWCYLDDLIAQADKAERLQKAVDLALNWLHTIATAHHPTTTYYNLDAQTAIDEIKQLIKGE